MKIATVILGIVLIAVAVAWFFTPYPDALLEQFGIYPSYETRGAGGGVSGNWELINTALNAANAFFAAAGVYLTLKGVRSK